MMSEIIASGRSHLIISYMASGKTGATLDALLKRLNRFEAHHVLVIAPLFVAANTWPDEIKAWEHTRAASFAAAVGDPIQRRAAISARKEFTFINFENLVWLAKYIGTIENWYWDTVVIDESSRFKSGEGRTKATKTKRVTKEGQIEVKVNRGGNMTRFGVMTTARRKVKQVIELTGTPAPKGLIDLWGQAYLLDQGERLGQSKTAFEKRWFDRDPYTYVVSPKANAEREILERLQDVLTTIPREKVCEDAQFFPIKVELPELAMKQYREFERTLYSEPYDVEAVTSGVLANKLMQFANSSMYREDRSVVPIHDAKLDALDELVETVNGESLLIFYGFKFDKDAIRKRHPDAVVANEYKGDLVGDWNKGRIKKLLAHPTSIGHGTNMQYGGHLAAWYGLTFSLELWEQANMRLPRPGQTEQVMIFPIIAKGTYDERALSILSDRKVTQDRIVASFLSDFHF